MPDVKGQEAVGSTAESVDTLRKLQGYLRAWANTTETARLKFKRDFEMTEGNGKQWRAEDRAKVEATGRPALEFNQIYPQVELVCGIQRSLELDFTAVPRGLEDRRLGEVASAALKAAKDFTRVQRISDKVFDDGIICGLGVWEVLHSLDDPDDLVWGDIIVNRINPMTFIYDPWATQPDLQDGAYMGKGTWMSIEDFKDRYPSKAALAVPGEWMTRFAASINSADDLGTGPNLMKELFDAETGRIRVITLWNKVPTKIALIIDTETGWVREVKNKAEGEKLIREQAEATGRESVRKYNLTTSDATSAVIDETGQIAKDPRTGAPLQFADREMAGARLNELADQNTIELLDRYKVVTRQARVPEWTEMCWWDILDSGKTPFRDRSYPFVAYMSRQFSDDPESIQGIVRNLQDPQEEYNKRYSNILAHQNSSSHSGWMNRKSGGANKGQLEQMGSKPGIVVEYSTMAPTQIRPVEMSQGHFAMLTNSERNILRISGVNAELVGQTTQATVSGRAIRARQEGGTTILKPRFRAYEESELDLARMLLSRIQQYYPVEKLKRIVGVAELSSPLGANGQSVFTDPISGKPLDDNGVIQVLSDLRNTSFDLVLKLSPATATERQAQFEQAVQLAGLITSTGKPLGANTMQAMVDLADMPTRLGEGLKRDAEAASNPAVMEPGGQNQAIQGLIGQVRGGRAGGSEGVVGG